MPSPIVPSTRSTEPTMKSSLDALREALAAMSPADIDPAPGLDASQAAGIVMGSLPRIAKHREAIVERFGAEGTAIIDGLADVAYATEQANVEVASADAISDLSAMHADLLEEHALLLGDATALANRKLIERNRLDAGRPILGYRPSITSTLVLVSLFREHWAVVAGKTPLRVRKRRDCSGWRSPQWERANRAPRVAWPQRRTSVLGVNHRSSQVRVAGIGSTKAVSDWRKLAAIAPINGAAVVRLEAPPPAPWMGAIAARFG